MKTMKKLLLPCLIAVFVLLLSAVPAHAASSTVASIGSKNYSSLAKAISAVKSGQTIVLKKNVTYSEKLTISKSGKSFTINLNKKTITFKSGAYLNLKKGTVTIKNGKIRQKSKTEQYGLVIKVAKGAKLNIQSGTYRGTFKNAGTLNIKNGTFVSYGTILYNTSTGTTTITKGSFTGSNNVTDAMNPSLIENEGKMTIKGGTFGFSVSEEIGIDGWGICDSTGESATLSIKGGTFTSDNVILSTGGGASVTISGGTFKYTGDYYMIYTYGSGTTVVIKDGTFKMTKAGIFLAALDSGKITAKGGSFTGKKGYLYYKSEGGSISLKSGIEYTVKAKKYTEE